MPKDKKRVKDKSDRATRDSVLDNRTRTILSKLITRDVLKDMTGCISRGKEANVYTALVNESKLTCKLINTFKNPSVCFSNVDIQKSQEYNDSFGINEASLDNSNYDGSDINQIKSNGPDLFEGELFRGNKINSCKVQHHSPTTVNESESDQDVSIIDILQETSVNESEFIPCAIKIYQTSIMEFKDRIKYIQSEKRFETFCNTNPRKLVKLWAEKEVRNLKRLNKNGIPSPRPIYLKRNVLLMSLIETSTQQVAPRLKDAVIDDYQELYYQAVDLIDRMYNSCGLVHSDLSEYNILYDDVKLIIIDMGQAVEKSHDNSDEFLIMDINNVNRFFLRKNCVIFQVNELFERITKKVIPFCLKNVELRVGVNIPTSLNTVSNKEDLAQFLKVGNSVFEGRKKERNENIEVEIDKKEERKKVKEEQRMKRANKIPKKVKKKIENIRRKK